MILGMSLQTFTLVHVVLSLAGITTGILVVGGMLRGEREEGWTAIFLVTTLLTSVTGFFFPASVLLPSHIVGIVSVVVLVPTLIAIYVYDLAGWWRWVYIPGALLAFYLNVLVGVVQAFQKISFLQALAPTQSEIPFLVAQGMVLVLFCVLAPLALMRFKPEAMEV